MDIGHKETDKKLEALTKQLQELYTGAYKEIELKHLETKYLINHLSNVADPKELEKLYRRNERLEAQLKAIAHDISNANAEAYKMINGELLNVYDLNYKYGAYSVETESGLEVYTDYNVFNKDIIKRLVADNENPFTLIALDEMLDKDLIYRDLKRTFLNEIIKGGSINDIAKRVMDIVNKNLNDAIRIARTETTRLESMGRQDSFLHGKDIGLQLKKVWISTADRRTRDRHLQMNGETKELEEKFSNGLMYPGEFGGRASEVINCRCTHITELQGVEKSAELQALDEKYKKATFDEWQRRKQAEADKQAKKQAKTNKNSGGDLSPLLNIIGSNYGAGILSELAKHDYKNKEIFYKYLKNIKFDTMKEKGTAHYLASSKGISIDILKDSVNPRGAWCTLFHEYGHLIDNTSMGTGYKYTSTDVKYNFSNKLKTDLEAYAKGVKKKLEKENPDKKVTATVVKNYMKILLRGNDNAGLSDICGGASNKRYEGWFGHTASYWKSDVNKLPKEAFANMFQIYLNGKAENIQLLEEIFPTATETFKEMLNNI